MTFLDCLKTIWTDPPICVCTECTPWVFFAEGGGSNLTFRQPEMAMYQQRILGGSDSLSDFFEPTMLIYSQNDDKFHLR